MQKEEGKVPMQLKTKGTNEWRANFFCQPHREQNYSAISFWPLK